MSDDFDMKADAHLHRIRIPALRDVARGHAELAWEDVNNEQGGASARARNALRDLWGALRYIGDLEAQVDELTSKLSESERRARFVIDDGPVTIDLGTMASMDDLKVVLDGLGGMDESIWYEIDVRSVADANRKLCFAALREFLLPIDPLGVSDLWASLPGVIPRVTYTNGWNLARKLVGAGCRVDLRATTEGISPLKDL